jgi:hypothetical protein
LLRLKALSNNTVALVTDAYLTALRALFGAAKRGR